jgi:Fic family protein
VDIHFDAVQNHGAPLSLARLNGWHAALFPLGYSGFHKITAGNVRKGDMRVISGRMGREKIHFEAPSAQQAGKELKAFIIWFNRSLGREDGILRAASAHLKFVTIHPYDDGNGRLSRALTDMAMAQDEKILLRSYSLSAQIMKERKTYYARLEDVQNLRAGLSEWLEWFLAMFIRAIENSRDIMSAAFFKAAFWNKIKDIPLNERQTKVLKKMLDSGPAGFQGGLTTRKYAAMTKTSGATAYREIADMHAKGLLTRYGAGRSVRYEISHTNQAFN